MWQRLSNRLQMAFEQWYPLIGGAAIAAAYSLIKPAREYVLPDTMPNLLSAILTVAGVAIGFLATVKSILISIDERPIVQRMKEAGIYRRVIGYLRAAITWSFILTFISAAALLLSYKEITTWTTSRQVLTAIWLAVAAGALLSYYRIARIWRTILDRMDTEHPR